jgi:hypothetical protein
MRLSRLAPIVAFGITLAFVGNALPSHAVGPGGWDRLGVGTGGTTPSLNGHVLAMNTDLSGVLLAAGSFTNAGGVTGANRIASWDGSAWSAVGPASSLNGDVHALAVAGGKIYAGGAFTNAGTDANADFLAVYDGAWHSFCTPVVSGAPFNGTVNALQVVGDTLYVGGSFSNGAGIDAADFLVGCKLATGAASPAVDSVSHAFGGAVDALTSDAAGHLYAGGAFTDLEAIPQADHVAGYLGGGVWTALGSGPGLGGSAVDSLVRSLAAGGTTLYVGADSVNIAGLAKADHIAAWDGASWHAMGANAAGTDGYLPAATEVDALFTSGSHVYAGGTWTNVGGDPTADHLADFDGTSWKPVSSNGAGDGALNAKCESMARFGNVLHVGGSFTEAGGDILAQFIARYTGIAPPTNPPTNPPSNPPSNVFTLGKAKPNKANGTAELDVTVPGAGALVLSGKGVKGLTQAGSSAGTVVLKIKPKGKLLKQLRAGGKAKVKVSVTYTPTGGTARSETKNLKLVLRGK